MQGVPRGDVLGHGEGRLHELRCWHLPKRSRIFKLPELPIGDLFEFSWSCIIVILRKLFRRHVLRGWVRHVHSLHGRHLRVDRKSVELHWLQRGLLRGHAWCCFMCHLCG